MKINFVVPIPGDSGGLKVIYRYAKEFEKRGNSVNLYFPLIPYCLKEKNIIWRIFNIITGMTLNIIRYCLMNYETRFDKDVIFCPVPIISNRYIPNADIVIATAWPTAFDVAKLNHSKGNKFYFVQDYEIWDIETLGKKSYSLDLYKIVISKWIKDTIIMQLGKGEGLPIVNNGIDPEIYRNENKDYSSRTKKDYKCLMLYHTLPKKGIDYGIKAFELAREKYPNIKLIMFGIKRGVNIPEYVEFHENPSREALICLYKESDIFIYPSLVEGWGLTVVEAMAASCAVVGTQTGCLLDIGVHGETVLFSPIMESRLMADNIVGLINSPELLEKISINGNKAIQKFAWANSTDQFINILKGNFRNEKDRLSHIL